jgi:hypothetical protein
MPSQKESRLTSYVWPVCLILVGLVLLKLPGGVAFVRVPHHLGTTHNPGRIRKSPESSVVRYT